MNPIQLQVDKVLSVFSSGDYDYEMVGTEASLCDLLDCVSTEARHAIAGTRMQVFVSPVQFSAFGVEARRLRINGKGDILWPADAPVEEYEIDPEALEAMGVEKAHEDSSDDFVPCSRWISVIVPKTAIPRHAGRVTVRKTHMTAYTIMRGDARGVVLCDELAYLFPALEDMPVDHTFDLLVSKESVEGWHQMDIDKRCQGGIEALGFDMHLEPALLKALDASSQVGCCVPCSRWLWMDACVPDEKPVLTFRITKSAIYGEWTVNDTGIYLCSDIEIILPDLQRRDVRCQANIRVSLEPVDGYGYVRCHIDCTHYLTSGRDISTYIPYAVLRLMGLAPETGIFEPRDIWLCADGIG